MIDATLEFGAAVEAHIKAHAGLDHNFAAVRATVEFALAGAVLGVERVVSDVNQPSDGFAAILAALLHRLQLQNAICACQSVATRLILHAQVGAGGPCG